MDDEAFDGVGILLYIVRGLVVMGLSKEGFEPPGISGEFAG